MAPKYIDIADFSREGYLQEVNRQFFHPLGLALVVEVDDDGEERLKGVWDARDDPEGMIFSDGVLDPEKTRRVAEELAQRTTPRLKALGYTIQPT
jgi:hypothetical protein